MDGHYVEPYAGGASVALYLLMTNRVKEITINDLDRAIYAFWFSVLHHTDQLCHTILHTPITVSEWEKQKKILAGKNTEEDVIKLGFATLFLNRTNFSGILNGGMIGGRNQTGKYKLDCRFNKAKIIKKIKAIADKRDRIHLTNLDALDLIAQVPDTPNTIYYFDPPYYLKGPSLYMNHYNYQNHLDVSNAIKEIRGARWIVSYDNTPEIQELYRGLRRIDYSFNHSAGGSREGRETIFFSNNILVDKAIHPVTLRPIAY